jgi:hypothetical protein
MNDAGGTRHINGSCHCGNITFTLVWHEPPETIPIRACGCALCRKHNAAWTSSPQGQFTMHIKDEDKVYQYQFGTKTADFNTCTKCGVIPIVTSEIEGTRYAVVNAYTFDNVDPAEMTVAATDFEGEDTGTRLTRRQRNWTPEG